MKILATLISIAFVLSLSAFGCASNGNTKEDEQVTEESTRDIEPATSGGMQRGFAEEEPEAAPADDEPSEESGIAEDEAPE